MIKKISFLLSMGLTMASSIIYAADTIKIASIFAKTGTAAVGNLTAIEGTRFAVEEINRKGGLLGKKIEIIEIDNHSTALYSKIAAQEAVKKRVVTVIGANWSSHSLAMAPVLQTAKIPMISPFSTNVAVTEVGDYIFRVCFIDSFQGRIMASFAYQDLKARKAAVLINANSRYSEGLAAHFQKHFTKLGGEISAVVVYLEDNDNFKPDLMKVLKTPPDVLFLPGHVKDSSYVIRQARNVGFSAPILGGDGWGNSMYEHAGRALDNTYFSDHWHEQKDSPESRRFTANFRKYLHKQEDTGTALAYDAVYLFANAVKRANSTDPRKIREALAATENYQGVTGIISFNPNRNPIKSGVISQYQSGIPHYIKTVNP